MEVREAIDSSNFRGERACHRLWRAVQEGWMYMIRKSFCEQFIKRYSMSIRVAVALNLVNRYGVSQFQAAKITGLPQPLLNYVIRGKRKIPGVRKILENRRITEFIDEVSHKLIEGHELDMCEICMKVREALGIPQPTLEERGFGPHMA